MHAVDFRSDTVLGRFIWCYIWGPVNLFIVFFPLAILNLLQFPSLLILPFSRQWFRRYNRRIAYLNWGWWAYGAEHIIGLKIIRTGDTLYREITLITNPYLSK